LSPALLENWPAVVACDSVEPDAGSIAEWVEKERDGLALQLSEHGALLLRGLPLESAADFDAFVTALGGPVFSYRESLSNAVRKDLTPRVFTANEAPPSATIHLHHEMAQTPRYPRELRFFCERPAETGGATSLCRSDWLCDLLERECPSLLADCERKGLRYTTRMPDASDAESGQGRSWRSTFSAQSRADAERALAGLGYTGRWLDDGSLLATSPALPAVRRLATGGRAFFNQLIAAWTGWHSGRATPPVTLGDGTPLERPLVELAIELAESIARDAEWQRGDVALVDNLRVMHGRRHFSGARRVLASFSGEGRAEAVGGA
jgi:hypothetical protein